MFFLVQRTEVKIIVYRLTETAEHISSVGLHVEKTGMITD